MAKHFLAVIRRAALALVFFAAAAAGAKAQDRAAQIAAAKQEGMVSYRDTIIQPETHDASVAGFRQVYGLPTSFQVKNTLSATLAPITKVEQETTSGNATVDVASIASPPWVNSLVAAGHVMNYDSPEYAAYGAAFAAKLGRPGYYAFNGGYVFVPMWNAGTLTFKGKSWKDVLGAVPSGRIGTNDGGNSATGLLTYMNLRDAPGLDFCKSLAAMKPAFVVRSEGTAERRSRDRT